MKITKMGKILIVIAIIGFTGIASILFQGNEKSCTEEAVQELDRRIELICKDEKPCFIEDDLELHILDIFKDEVYECIK